MTEAGIFSAVFLVGVTASIIGAMVGGGSLLSVPLLLFLGLPPHVAIATDRFAGLGVGATALYRFWPSGKIVWRYVPVLALASLAGSLIGATWLIRAEPGALRVVVGALLLVLLPLLFLKPDLGVVPREVSRLRIGLGVVLYLLVQILAGFFGGGTGTLIFFILMSCFGVTVTQVAATQILPFLLAKRGHGASSLACGRGPSGLPLTPCKRLDTFQDSALPLFRCRRRMHQRR